MAGNKFYAVRLGRQVGIYNTWDECQRQVHGFPKAQFKSFKSLPEAQEYMGTAAANARNPTQGTASTYVREAGQQQPTPVGQKRGPQHAELPHQLPYTKQQRSDGASLQHGCSVTQQPQQQDPSRNVRGTIGLMIASTSAQPATEGQQGRSLNYDVLVLAQIAGVKVQQPARPVVKEANRYAMNFDGASRGNPGHAGAGACIVDTQTGATIAELVCPLPYGTTNNEAEYAGLIMGLQACVELGIVRPIIRGDSKLVCMQVNGKWQVQKEHLMPCKERACSLLDQLQKADGSGGKLQCQFVYRDQNKHADELSNRAIDMQSR